MVAGHHVNRLASEDAHSVQQHPAVRWFRKRAFHLSRCATTAAYSAFVRLRHALAVDA